MFPMARQWPAKTRRITYAHYGSGTRERIGSVFHGSGFGRHEARGAKRKSGPISFPQLVRLWHDGGVLLPEWPSKVSEA